MVGSRDAFEQVFGAPTLLGDLIAMTYIMGLARTDDVVPASAALDAHIEAMGVGVAFDGVAEELLRDLAFRSDWSLHGIYREEPVAGLLTRIASLHDREASGTPVGAKEWQSLQREAVDLTDRGIARDASENVETLASSASTWNVAVVYQILERSAGRHRYPSSSWTEDDANRLTQRARRNSEQITAAIGPLPKTKGPGRDNWHVQRAEHAARLKRADKEADPEFWQRADAWQQHLIENRVSFAEDAARLLLVRIEARSNGTKPGC
ncbi:hypothetical protein [Paraburkholderia tropica]|uniref:hypothetical protein n=1 Tax=Paraburkholderia tropica TaxID=92647 RepID=UPI002AB61E8D|nr:hypothetical protein [Paraburkholderia tropica]